MFQAPSVDYKELFESVPGLYLALLPNDPVFTIVAVSNTFLDATMTQRESIVDRPLFEVFPANPGDPEPTGVSNLHASLTRVLSDLKPDAMAVQKYDIRRPDSQGGGFEERFWSPSNSPVLRGGKIVYIIHRVEDVTDFLRLRQIGADQERAAAGLRVRTGQLEAEVFMRAQQLQQSNAQLRDAYRELRDLGERQSAKATADLEKSERRYRTLASATSSIIWTVNSVGAFVESQPSWSAFTGQSLSEYRGFGWLNAIHTEDRESMWNCWAEAVANTRAFEIEARIWKAAANSYRYFVGRGVPVVGSNGLAEEWIGTVTDIEDSKRLEEQLRHSAKLESLGVLAGGIAHDFNNLLTGIMGNASLAREIFKTDHPEDGEILENILSASERAAHLTRQMLAYSGKGRFELQDVDLSELVREITTLVQSSIPKYVHLRLELQENPPCIEADPGQIQQIVMNLIINAAEAIPEKASGSVVVSTSVQAVDDEYSSSFAAHPILKTGPYVALQVRDNGIGMSEETKARIFDPFFTTKVQGRGLGLSAVMGIVHGHKGAMRVSSSPGQGTSFEVLFPATAARAEKPRIVKPVGRPVSDGLILMIDDEELLRRTGRTVLRQKGYNVIIASDGAEGIRILRSIPNIVDLVVLDLTMPGMSGEETLEGLLKIRPDVPVILSSGYDEVEATRRFTGMSLASFLKKPFTAAELTDAVEAALTARPANLEPEIP